MNKYLLFLLSTIFSVFSVTKSYAQLPQKFGKLDLKMAIASLPSTSKKPFEEVRLLDNGDVGIRVFRVYNPVSQHHHAYSSTYLTIHSGRGLFKIKEGKVFEAGTGDMVFWERGVEHEVVRILEHPLVFVTVDTPTRRSRDVQKKSK